MAMSDTTVVLDPALDPFDPIILLSRDLRQAAQTLSAQEARYLVDSYYIMQEDRKRAHNQVRALGENQEPHAVIIWLADNSQRMEDNIKRALESYAAAHEVSQWAMRITGIGPIIAAGLLAHVDITKSPTVSALWRFAGQDPTSEWEKSHKRPWNASLKVLCWKAGESFVKFQNHRHDHYGKFYRERKEAETTLNQQGRFQEQAKVALSKKQFGQDTQARKWYEQGQLPPAHIHARAKRWAVKLFLSHYWEVAYTIHYGTPSAQKPYVMDHLGHTHYIPIPEWP